LGGNLEHLAVVNSRSATLLQVVENELIQKYLGYGPKLVQEHFLLLMSFPHSLSSSMKLMLLGGKGRFHSVWWYNTGKSQ
jgi:hypothetical protein